MRLIDADRLKEVFRRNTGYDYADIIDMQPTVNALDKIRAEIEAKYGQCDICEYFEDYDYEENDISEYRPVDSIGGILKIIDKYKAKGKEV